MFKSKTIPGLEKLAVQANVIFNVTNVKNQKLIMVPIKVKYAFWHLWILYLYFIKIDNQIGGPSSDNQKTCTINLDTLWSSDKSE